MVDSCLDCNNCKIGDENYCEKGMTGTYNGERKHGRTLYSKNPIRYGFG